MIKARSVPMLRKFWVAGFALLAIFLAVRSTEACSCAGGSSPCQEYGRVSAVFVGTPIAVRTVPRPTNSDSDEYWAPRTFTFSVETSFLGLAAREGEVSTGLGGGDCGYDII